MATKANKTDKDVIDDKDVKGSKDAKDTKDGRTHKDDVVGRNHDGDKAEKSDKPGNTGGTGNGQPGRIEAILHPLNGYDEAKVKAEIAATLKDFRMTAMKNEVFELADDMDAGSRQLFLTALRHSLLAEENLRNTNKQTRLIRSAGLQLTQACPEDIEHIPSRHMDTYVLNQLLDGSLIREHHHAILCGATGCGKTYIASAAIVAACRRGYRARFVRLPDLINEFTFAKSDGTYNKVRNLFVKQDLIVIDEWLLRPLSFDDSYELLEIIDACSRCCSLVFCSQFDPGDWYARIDCNRGDTASTIAEAVLDRIVHNAQILKIESDESMRHYYSVS